MHLCGGAARFFFFSDRPRSRCTFVVKPLGRLGGIILVGMLHGEPLSDFNKSTRAGRCTCMVRSPDVIP